MVIVDAIAKFFGLLTLKTQVVVRQKSGQVICLEHGKGRIHDFRLFKTSGVRFGELLKVIADKGYQGIKKIHQLSETPIKKLSRQENINLQGTVLGGLCSQ